MQPKSLILSAAALLLGLVPLTTAHGSDQNDHVPSPAKPTTTAVQMSSHGPESYFAHSAHSGTIYAHIFLMILAWIIALPVAVMLSVARSRFTLLAQFCFLVVNGFGILTGVVYNQQTPDLYEKNAHNPIGWIATWMAAAWMVLGLVKVYAKLANRHEPWSVVATTRYEPLQQHTPLSPNAPRWSDDSGQGTERNSGSLYSHSRSGSLQNGVLDAHKHENEDDEDILSPEGNKRSWLLSSKVDGFLARVIPRLVVGPTPRVLDFCYSVIDRTILLVGFFGLTSGIIVFGGIARGNHVFNILAHFVKGGIFFWYGLLTLGRWMGAFADFGWAWNVKPPRAVAGRWQAAMPSAEFTESFVMFLYGTVNVFMEHLAAWGGAWAPEDLEHVSISIMFFGGGLLGMLVESRKIRNLLNITVQEKREQEKSIEDSHWKPPRTYEFPMNPMPGLVILLLGIMMGSHHQHSMVSTMIHKQWGLLFVGFAIARAITYLILFIAPPTSYFPSRPPTELIAAFCLISGGIVFMESNKDTVGALEHHNLDAMFTFIVSVGLTALTMAWATLTYAIKGWGQRRQPTADPDSQASPLE